MKKKITIIVIVTSIFILLSTYIYYLQFGRNMDVVNSMSLNSYNYREENIRVILNKIIITEKEKEIARDIIQHILDNDFHTIKFSFKDGYPNRLKVFIYKNEKDLKLNNQLFSFIYEQFDGEIGDYDISQDEHMRLEIQ